MRRLVKRRLWIGLLAAATAAGCGGVRAQDLEPRALSPAPVGLNFLVAGYSYARGGLAVDPSLPLDNPDLKLAGPLFAYARTLDLGGLSGKVDVILPVARLSGTARYFGQPVARRVDGLGDPLVRLSAILYGAPAMSARDFKDYKQNLLIGAGLQLGAPFGEYDSARLLNLGGNRWIIRPDIGISKTIGRWVLEATSNVSLYTENDDFLSGHRRTESPIYADQAHLIYNWPSGVWASIDAVYFTGGQGRVDGVRSGKRLQNIRTGGTLTLPVTQRYSVKIFGSAGVSERTHSDFGLFGIAWQYRWGAGF